MDKTKLAVLVVAATAVAGLTIYGLSLRRAAHAPLALSQDVVREQVATPPLTTAVQPPEERAPLRIVLRTLSAAARDGNSGAACRIARDIFRCTNATSALDVAEALAGSPRLPGQANRISEQLLAQTDEDAEFCAGVPAQELAKGYEYQRLAAQNGDKRYSRWLAVMPALNQDDFLNNIDEWADYRKRAKEYFDRALASRDGDDLGLLLMVYAPKHIRTLRPPYRVHEPLMFLALSEVARRNRLLVPTEVSQEAARLKSALSAEERSRLNALVVEMSNGWSFTDPTKPPHSDYVVAHGKSFCS